MNFYVYFTINYTEFFESLWINYWFFFSIKNCFNEQLMYDFLLIIITITIIIIVIIIVFILAAYDSIWKWQYEESSGATHVYSPRAAATVWIVRLFCIWCLLLLAPNATIDYLFDAVSLRLPFIDLSVRLNAVDRFNQPPANWHTGDLSLPLSHYRFFLFKDSIRSVPLDLVYSYFLYSLTLLPTFEQFLVFLVFVFILYPISLILRLPAAKTNNKNKILH